MGAVCESCLNDIPQSSSLTEFDIEDVKKRKKARLALPSLIKIQAAWRGYILRKKLRREMLNSPLNDVANMKLGKFSYNPQSTGMVKRPPHKYPNKSVYIGEWNPKIGCREGKGIHIWSDGSRYEGYWKSDMANGKGRLIHSDGDVYEGEWLNDKAHGRGTYIHMDGAKY